MANELKYKEDLPESCPLPDSQDEELTDVWRLLESSEPSPDSFDSHAARGRVNKQNVCECRWASCSLFAGDSQTAAMLKTPLYKRFAARAELKVPAGSGRSFKKKNHVDFWAYDSFDFAAAVVRVEAK